MRIPESVIEQLNSQADLVGIIGKHTTLKPAGREFKGNCPFHGERTPSFYVNPQTNLYYCFGCHAKGNAITFLKEFERLNFIEAVKLLAEQTGVELPKDDEYAQKIRYNKTKARPQPPAQHTAAVLQADSPNPANPHFNHQPANSAANLPAHTTADFHSEYQQMSPDLPNYADFAPANAPFDAVDGDFYSMDEQAQTGDLYVLLNNICNYYQQMLQQTPAAKQYFLDRGVSEESIARFALGYAPAGWQHLEQAFAEDIEGLKILGLVRDSQKNSERSFDLLRHRVIFPIRDTQGRVVGFAGRTLGDELPKYINSSESPVFQKQHILYGLYESRQARASSFLMVEGYMDVIALYQAGIYGAVAPMGTAANEKQIERLLRYHDTLTLCFDGDSAGQRAAWRTLQVAAPVLQDGKTLKFLTLPDKHDPDTYLAAHGTAAMRDEIARASSLSDYIYQVLGSRFDLSLPEQKAAAMAHLRELTDLFPKGASLKWWLNNDIYQRLKNPTARRAFVDRIAYNAKDSDTTAMQLCLCLLHTPSLLQPNPLATLLNESGIANIAGSYRTHLDRQGLDAPDLPTLAAFGDELAAMTATIGKLQSLDVSTLGIDFASTDSEQINRRAHFILASLSDELLRENLATRWQSFFAQMHKHSVQPLLFELLCQATRAFLHEQSSQSKNLVLTEIIKKRLQLLADWENHYNKTHIAALLDE